RAPAGARHQLAGRPQSEPVTRRPPTAKPKSEEGPITAAYHRGPQQEGLTSMLHIASALPSDNQNLDRNHLARIRRLAKKRGFRVLKDWSGSWSLVDARIQPPRALVGLVHVTLTKIEIAVLTPLPEIPPRRRNVPAPSANKSAVAGLMTALRATAGNGG